MPEEWGRVVTIEHLNNGKVFWFESDEGIITRAFLERVDCTEDILRIADSEGEAYVPFCAILYRHALQILRKP